MKTNLLNLLLILILSFSNQSISQTIRQWDLIDYNPKLSNTNSINYTKSLEGLNEDDIILCSVRLYYDSIPDEKIDFKYNVITHITKKSKSIKEIYKLPNRWDNIHWNSIAYPSQNVIVIVGDSILRDTINKKNIDIYNSYITLTRDSGKNFETIIIDSNQYFTDISMCDSMNGIILPWNKNNLANPLYLNTFDSLLVTNDCWKSIQKIPFPKDSCVFKKVYSFSIDNFAILALNYKTNQSYFYFSTNNGLKWNKSRNISDNFWVFDIEIVGNTIYAVGSEYLVPEIRHSTFYKSTDNGSSWNQIKSINDTNYFNTKGSVCMDFFDENNGIIAQGEGLIKRTTDGGNSWVSEISPFIPEISKFETNTPGQVFYANSDFAIGFSGKSLIRCDTSFCLDTPQFLNLKNRTYQNINSVSLSWVPIDGADKYRIKLSKVMYGSSLKIDNFNKPDIDSIINENIITINGLEFNCFYYVWIKAIGNNFTSNWSQNYVFKTIRENDSLYSPEFLYPINYSLNNHTDLTVRWNKVPGAIDYQLYIYYDNMKLWDFDNHIQDTFKVIKGLLPNRAYTLKINANSDSSQSIPNSIVFITGNTTSMIENNKVTFERLNVFPNPAKDFCNIIFFNKDISFAEISISNLMGIELLKSQINLVEGFNQVPVDISKLQTGIYFLKIFADKDFFLLKLIKE